MPTTGAITLGKDGINAGNKQIKGVAKGMDDTDAVNVSQLKAVEDKIVAINGEIEKGTIEKDGTGVKFELGKAEKESIIQAEIDRVVEEIKKENPAATEEDIKAAVEAKTAEMESNIKNAITAKENAKLATAKNVAEMIKHATERGSISEDATVPGKVTASLTDAQKAKIEEAAKKAAQAAGESDPEKLKQAAKDTVTAAEAANKEKLASVGNVAEMINAAGFNATIGNDTKNFTDQKGKAEASINAGDDVIFQSGKNLKVKQEITTLDGKDTVKFTYALADNIALSNNGNIRIGAGVNIDSSGIEVGGGVSVKNSGINAGGKTISNVGKGIKPTDAVNLSQLEARIGDVNNYVNQKFNGINNRVNRLDKTVRGVGASAAAAASLPQVYLPGKSLVAASVGRFKGESAVSIGYSRTSDNGKLIFKLQGTANSQGDILGGAGIGYLW